MAEIEWLMMPGRRPKTWNPIRGCSPVSPGCDHCWARIMARRGMHTSDEEIRGWDGTVKAFPARLAEPFGWEAPRCVAVGLMSDVGHENLDDTFRAAIHGAAILNPDHLFIFVTKRPENLGRFRREYGPLSCIEVFLEMDEARKIWEPTQNALEILRSGRDWEDVPNVWDLVSVEDQATADERIPELLAMPSAMRGLSVEPMLEPVDPSRWLSSLDWVVIEGESGPSARMLNAEWPRKLIAQTTAAGVPTFMKQAGRYVYDTAAPSNGWRADQTGFYGRLKHPKGADPFEWPSELRVREWPEGRRHG